MLALPKLWGITMHPPVFEVLSADPVVRNLLLSNSSTIVKIFAAREVPQDTQAPYVAWGLSGGSPENYLGDDADMDQYSTQLDVFAPTLRSEEHTTELQSPYV